MAYVQHRVPCCRSKGTKNRRQSLLWIKYTDYSGTYIAGMYNNGEVYVGFMNSDDPSINGPIRLSELQPIDIPTL